LLWWRTPAQYRQRVLLFGAFLLWTAFSVARDGGAEEGEVGYHENALMRVVR